MRVSSPLSLNNSSSVDPSLHQHRAEDTAEEREKNFMRRRLSWTEEASKARDAPAPEEAEFPLPLPPEPSMVSDLRALNHSKAGSTSQRKGIMILSQLSLLSELVAALWILAHL